MDVRADFVGPASLGISLWNSVIIQKLLHNACSWIAMAQKTTRRLERIQLQFFKRLYSLPPSAPNAGTWWISGCIPLSWRILAAKFKFAQHLTARGEDTVAGRVWDLEKRGWLPGGIYGELTEAHRLHGIPMPNPAMNKEEYNTVVDRATFRVAVEAVRTAALASSKLRHMRHHTTYGSEINNWHSMEDIKLTARAKLSCVPEFGADWGREDRCECGARDTFLHAAEDELDMRCDRYAVARAAYPNRLNDDAALLKFTKEVLRIKELTNMDWRGGG